MGKGAHRVAVLACLAACHCWFDGPDPDLPEGDCRSCQSEGQFQLDPTCELTGELRVEIGEGPDEFLPLAQGDAPELYSAPQGGGFLYMAVRVEGIDASRYDQLELVVDGYFGDECPEGSGPCSEGFLHQTFVLGGDRPWRLVDDGVEEYGIMMPLDGGSVLQAEVRDPCGRQGWAQHRW